MSDWRKPILLFQIRIIASLVLDFSSIVLNGLIAYLLKKNKKTNIVTFWFMYCLSISDFMVGATGLVYHTLLLDIAFDPKIPKWDLLHTLFAAMYGYYTITSWMLILIIAVDRYIHMNYSHNYCMIMTKFRARLIMLFNVIFGILVGLPPIVTHHENVIWFQFALYIFFTVGTLATFVIYLILYFLIRRQVSALQICESGNASDQGGPGNSAQCHIELTSLQDCELSMLGKQKKIFITRNSRMMRRENDGYQKFTKETYQLSAYNTINPYNLAKYNEEDNDMEQKPGYVAETLQVDQQKSTDITKHVEDKNECQCKLPYGEACRECTNLKRNKNIRTPAGRNVLTQKRVVKQQNDDADCQNRIFVLPYSTYCSGSKMKVECDIFDNMESIAQDMGERKAYNEVIMNKRKAIAKPTNEAPRVTQVFRGRRTTPDEEVKKATRLILLAVFMCYVPGLIIFFYYFATGAKGVALSFISQLSVLLNSSLNAVILILCSKNLQRKLKAIFTRH